MSDRPIHADFMRVTDKTVIRVGVPVQVKNQKDCPGITKGGVLNLVRHEIEVYCPAKNIPEAFVVDLTGLNVGHSIHIGNIEMPAGVKPTTQGDFTIITLVAPSAMRSEVDEAAAAAAAAGEAAAAGVFAFVLKGENNVSPVYWISVPAPSMPICAQALDIGLSSL